MNKKIISFITALTAASSALGSLSAQAWSYFPGKEPEVIYDTPFAHFSRDGMQYRQDRSVNPTELYLVGFDEELNGDIVVPAEVDGIPVTTIYANFEEAGKVTSVTIPDTVTYVGQAFSECEDLQSVYLPDSVEEIGYACFRGCCSLTNVHFSKNIKALPDDLFLDCFRLSEVENLPDTVEFVGKDTLKGTAFPEDENGMRYLCGWAVDGKNAPEDVVIAEGTLGIAANFCKDSQSHAIKNITIPDSVTYIGDFAFDNCNYMEEISIPDTVKYIGENAFHNCSSLKNIKLPDSIEYLGAAAFSCCFDLGSVTFPQNKCPIDTLASGLFGGCGKLTDIDLGAAKIKKIEAYAFTECNSLTSFEIPDTVEEIEKHAFYYCDGLTSVTIPESVKSIGIYSFYYCHELKEIIVESPDWELIPIETYYPEGFFYDSIYTTGSADERFKAVVYGTEGSATQAHAMEFGLPFKVIGSPADEEPIYYEPAIPADYKPIYGDANDDGYVTIADATAILQHIGNGDKYKLTARGRINADCYDPGTGITGMDALAIQRKDAKINSGLPEYSTK